MIRFSVAPDQISPPNEVSFLTRPGRSLHHPITASLCSCFLMPHFYSFIPFACSTAAVLIYPPLPLHPINKQRTKKAASTCPRTAAERKTLQNNEVRCLRHRHTADDETEKGKSPRFPEAGRKLREQGGEIKGFVSDSGGLFQTTPRTPRSFFSSLIHIQSGDGSSPGSEQQQNSLKFHKLKHKKEKKRKI